jgi:transcriptional antiterminator RfaH
MSIGATEWMQRWYVVHTQCKQEDRADDNLKAWNIETFAPKLRERRNHPFTGETVYVIKPLFTGYIFARFDLWTQFHKVRFTRGIHSLVSFGDNPVPIEEEIIDIIRARIGTDGFVKIGHELRPGDSVVIGEGPLKNFSGIFEREMNESDRVIVLLNTVSFQAHAMIERDKLKRVASAVSAQHREPAFSNSTKPKRRPLID